MQITVIEIFLIILNVLKNSSGHLTAEQLYQLCIDNNVKVSIASIYRNLTEMANKGIVRKLSIPDSPDVFDKTPMEHGHLVCSKCGEIIDLGDLNISNLIKDKLDIEIDSYELSCKYVCNKCKKLEK